MRAPQAHAPTPRHEPDGPGRFSINLHVLPDTFVRVATAQAVDPPACWVPAGDQREDATESVTGEAGRPTASSNRS